MTRDFFMYMGIQRKSVSKADGCPARWVGGRASPARLHGAKKNMPLARPVRAQRAQEKPPLLRWIEKYGVTGYDRL